MKHFLFIFLSLYLLGFSGAKAQTIVHPGIYNKASSFYISRPLKDNPVVSNISMSETEFFANAHRNRTINPDIKAPDFSKKMDDPGEQDFFGKSKGATLIKNFTGQNSVSYPPDCNGTVNENYYFQVVNTTYQIFDKSGNSVAGPSNLNTIFDPSLNGANCNNGDPIVLWDEKAGRWFYSEFALCGSNDLMLIAVSVSEDPTGSWYSWSFDVDDMPDYMKFGIWQDGYYMATNNDAGNDVYVFERDAMLAGEVFPMMIGFNNPNRPVTFDGFHCILPLDNDGDWAPTGTPGQFITIADKEQGNTEDALYIYELDVDWETPANSTFARTQTIPVNAFSGQFTSDWNNIKQPGTTQRLDALSTILMYRAQYRKFGTTQKLVCVHAVAESAEESALRWYQLENTGSGWTLAQQGTYNPDGVSRWNASIAMNAAGEIGMGYSVSDATSTYPGIRFCGQSLFSIPNIMDIPEEIVWTGTNSQTAKNRWGDYANISVDPIDDRTFWFTSEYATSINRGTRIASFRFSIPDDPVDFAANGISRLQIDLSWNLNSSGEPVLIAWSPDGNFGTPVNGAIYSPGETIPGGGEVLTYGTSPLIFNHMGLTQSTPYFYRAWSYKSDNTYSPGITRRSETLSGNPIDFFANVVSSSQIDLSWILNINNDDILIAWSLDGIFGNPVNGTVYSIGEEIVDGGTILHFGAGNSSNHSALDPATKYYYKAWSYLNGTEYSSGVISDAMTDCNVVTDYPINEGFESVILPDCWSYEGNQWTFQMGGVEGQPVTAHSGIKNALFFNESYTPEISRLVSPSLDLSALSLARISFWHTQARWGSDQDELRVLYKTSESGEWVEVAKYTNNITSWTKRSLSLPNLSNVYSIAFEATAKYGYGVAIDDLIIEESVASVENPGNFQIEVYPNPSNGNFNIVFPKDTKNVNLCLIDFSGKIIYEQFLESPKFHKINMNTNSGVYFLQIKTNDKLTVSKLIFN